MMEKKRIVFADYVRVVACFMVMLVHASENFYGANNSGLAGNVSMLANEGNRFWVAFYDGFVSHTSVPLFMMVSAFLLVPLKTGMTMGEFYFRRMKRVLPPFVFFMLLYCLLPLLWDGMTWEQSLADLKRLPLNFPSMAGHLWFMYPLIGLYLVIPIISPWLEKATAHEVRICLGIVAFASFIPWIHRFVDSEVWGECFWNQYGAFWYFSGFIGYFIMAHYIHVHLDWSKARRIVVGLVCFLLGSSFTMWSFWWKGVPGQFIETPVIEWAWIFCSPNIYVATFGAFVLFTCIRPASGKAPAVITEISKLSFGMYLIHMFFLAPVAQCFIGADPAQPLIPVWCCIPLIAVVTYLCSIVAVKLVSYIPYSKYFVGI